MDREQDVAEGKCLLAVDSRWATEAILQEGGTPWLVMRKRLAWGGRALSRGLCEVEDADLPGPCGRLDAEQGQGRGRLICRGNRGGGGSTCPLWGDLRG